jgi:hypothetical protein
VEIRKSQSLSLYRRDHFPEARDLHHAEYKLVDKLVRLRQAKECNRISHRVVRLCRMLAPSFPNNNNNNKLLYPNDLLLRHHRLEEKDLL